MTSNMGTIWGSKKDDRDPNMEMFTSGGTQSNVGILRAKKRASNMNEDQNNNDSSLQNMAKDQQSQGISSENKFKGVIILYKNGYQIGEDGEFKDAADANNAKFIEQLSNGEIPHALEPQLRIQFGKEVEEMGVNIVDRKQTMFKPKTSAKPSFQAFKGEAHCLTHEPESMGQSFQTCAPEKIVLDGQQKSTRIQIILIGGKREAIKVNVNNTVLQLYAHVKAISGYSANFQLLAGFPPKPLTNPNETIENAKLAGARVTQKAI